MIATEAKMAQILVRNLEDQVKGRLQHRAKRHGRSMEEEVREILRNALREEETPKRGLGSEIVALFSGQWHRPQGRGRDSRDSRHAHADTEVLAVIILDTNVISEFMRDVPDPACSALDEPPTAPVDLDVLDQRIRNPLGPACNASRKAPNSAHTCV